MNREDAEEYTQSLGQIVGGSYRQIALAQRLGVAKALGMTIEDWVHERLGGYVKMSVGDRREAVAQLTTEGYSNREIAGVVGVDPETINRDQRAANAATTEKNDSKDEGGDDAPAANAAPIINQEGEVVDGFGKPVTQAWLLDKGRFLLGHVRHLPKQEVVAALERLIKDVSRWKQ
jgi:hypothetical protein